MRDFAEDDPRSVAAQLRGHGDGRAQRFDRFRTKFLKRNPDADESAVADAYEQACRSDILSFEQSRAGFRFLAALAMFAAAFLCASMAPTGSVWAGAAAAVLVVLGVRQIKHGIRRLKPGVSAQR